MKKLIATWVGEFGWELFCFQGILREMSDKYDITVCARRGHERLYQDFAKKFIPLDVSENTDCARGDNVKIDTTGYDEVYPPNMKLVFYSPFKYHEWQKTKQRFIPYGRKKDWYDYIIHARNTDKFKTGHRNWGRKNWEKLLPHLKGRIVTIGTKESALGFKGVKDLRGLPLSELVNHIASSKWIIGESSGAMHLASLCRTNQIVLSEGFNWIRYTKHWNPFNTQVKFISGHQLKFRVDLKDVINAI